MKTGTGAEKNGGDRGRKNGGAALNQKLHKQDKEA